MLVVSAGLDFDELTADLRIQRVSIVATHRVMVVIADDEPLLFHTGPRRMFPLVKEDARTLGPIFMNALPATHSEVEDISAAVAWLASDEARHVTGAALPLDMGTLLR